ncbi:MAG: hypothetical protein Q8K85_09870 [Hyphomicrobium sp.]|nr:hypothetical protein [Hyphomicrobium sp.]
MAAPNAAKKEVPAACQQKADKDAGDDADDNDEEDDEGVRFDLAGACAKLTGGVSYTYQKAQKTASGLPVFVNKNGTVSAGSSSHSVSANVGPERRARRADGGLYRLTDELLGWRFPLDRELARAFGQYDRL